MRLAKYLVTQQDRFLIHSNYSPKWILGAFFKTTRKHIWTCCFFFLLKMLAGTLFRFFYVLNTIFCCATSFFMHFHLLWSCSLSLLLSLPLCLSLSFHSGRAKNVEAVDVRAFDQNTREYPLHWMCAHSVHSSHRLITSCSHSRRVAHRQISSETNKI